jgi:ABC-type glycerol-3-phosphate transport system substrate-binding protein
MSASARMVVRAGWVLAVVTAFLLTGCGGGDATATDTTDTTTSTAETQPPSTTETTSTTTTEQPPPNPTVVRIRVVNASPKDGIVRAEVEQGDRVVIVVTSDVADEVHVHGYDVSRPVAAGGTVRLPFRATIPGRFEVELEERGVPIGELTVQP